MILITANKVHALLYFKFFQTVTAEEIRAHAKELRALVADLPAGLRLLSNLEELESMEKECAQEIGKIMDLLKSKGVELVVRIIPDPQKDIGLNILSVFHYGRDVRTVTCENFAEAIRILKL